MPGDTLGSWKQVSASSSVPLIRQSVLWIIAVNFVLYSLLTMAAIAFPSTISYGEFKEASDIKRNRGGRTHHSSKYHDLRIKIVNFLWLEFVPQVRSGAWHKRMLGMIGQLRSSNTEKEASLRRCRDVKPARKGLAFSIDCLQGLVRSAHPPSTATSGCVARQFAGVHQHLFSLRILLLSLTS